MSTSVDQRVVKMQFDNQQFESGVKSSIKSLEDLKKALNLDSMSDSLSSLSSAVSNISNKFSTLGVIGMSALNNITNKAMAVGSKIVKSLTIDPVISGFQEYETQINATQTILSNTSKEGATIKDVNAALDELNKYADLTIYNFTEMTKNIGTFTAAGVKLDTSVNAIQGIANLAAVSGSTSQQASTAMYQLSQALASGTLQLQDWNSVVNAGMGGQKFQDALKMTAKVHGINVDKMIKKHGSFRETLSKEKWITADILTETLQHFTAFTDEYNAETLKAQGYTEKQIAEIKAMGIDATEAATKVKTFTQLWDVVQEATQSGWSQSWRLIIGDFEQAKLTMTEFSDEVTAVINSISDRRNALLTAGLTSGINQFVTKAGVDFETYSDSLYEVAKNHGVAIDDMIKEDGSFEATLQRGWLTSDMLKESINNTSKSISGMTKKQLKAAGYTEEQAEAIAKFNAEVQNGTEDVDAWVETMGRASGRENLMESLLNIFKAIMAIAKPIREAFENVFPPMTGEQLYTITERIRAFTESLIISENTANKVKGFIEGLLTIVKPFITIIKDAVIIVGTLVGAVIPPLLKVLITVSGYIGTLYAKMGKLVDVNKLFDLETQLITKAIKGASACILKLGDLIGVLIERITGVDVGNFEDIEAILDIIFEKLTKVRDTVFEVLEATANGDGGAKDLVKTLKTKVGDALTSASEKYKTFSTETKAAIDGIVEFGKKVAAFFAPAIQIIKNAFKGVTITDLIGSGLLTGVFIQLKKFNKDVRSIKDAVVDVLEGTQGALEQYQKTLKAKTLTSIAIAVGILAASLLVLSRVDPANLKSSLIAMSVLLAEVMGTLKIILSDKFKFDTKEAQKVAAAAGVMILISGAFLLMAKAMAKLSVFQTWDDTWPALVTMITLMGGLTGAAIALNKFGADKDITDSAVAMMLLAMSVSKLAGAINKFAEMDPDKTKLGLTILGALLAEIAAFTKFSDMVGMEHARDTIIAIALSMILLAHAMELFGEMDPNTLTQGMTVLGLMLLALSGFLQSIAKTNIYGAASTLMALAVAMGLLIIPILAFGHMDLLTLAKGLLTLSGVFAAMSISLTLLKSASGGGLGGAAKSILAMAVAINMLVIPISILGSLGLTRLALGIGGLTAAMVALAATAVMIKLAAAAMMAVGKAMIFMGVGALAISVAVLGLTTALVTLATLGTVGIASMLASFAALVAGFIAMAPLIEEGLVTLINTLLNTIKRTGPNLIETVITLIDQLLVSIANHAESITRSLINIIIAIFKALIGIIKEYGPTLWQKAKEVIGKFVQGIGEGIQGVKEKGKELGKSLVNGIKKGFKNIKDAAGDAIEGFIKGLNIGPLKIGEAAWNLGSTFLSKFRKSLDEASPSKATKKIAEFAVEGFVIGINENIDDAGAAAENLGNAVKDSLVDDLAELFDQMTYGRKATALFMREFGDLSTVDSAKKSFEQASKAVQNYAKQLYLESDAYQENVQAVKDLEDEQASLEKQIKKLSKKSDDASKSSLETAKENLKETKKELKKARKEITEGTKQFIKNQKEAYEELQSSIASSLESYMDPLSMSLDTQIDMFKKFEESTDEVTAASLLENMASQVDGISKWNDRLEALANKGFAAALIEELKDLGPTATNYIKAFESMTAEEMNQANTYFQQSAQLTVDTFLDNWSDSKEAVTKWAENLKELAERGVSQGFLEAIAQAGMSTTELVNALMNATDAQLAELKTLYEDALVDEHGAQTVVMALAATGAGISTEFANALTSQISAESEAGTTIAQTAAATGEAAGNATATGITTATASNANTAKVTAAAEELGTAAVNGLKSKVNTAQGKKLGGYLCTGLVNGLKAGKSKVIQAAADVAAAALKKAKDNLGIDSPSKEFAKVGYWSDMGFAKGLKKYSGIVEDEAGEVGNASLRGVKNALSNIAKVVDSDMDTTPVIRPVIDLDNLRDGISSMNGMLANQVVDVDSIRAKTASISSGFGGASTSVDNSTKLQNGSSFSFVQNNYSPKALSQIEIYRQTKNQFSAMKGALQGV